jgi:aryl-alcohol dehydrogenase-like predicted oxidoreductase
VDFEAGVKAAEALRPYVPEGASMAQLALRWILMSDAVTCAIPGAKRPDHVADNTTAADLPPLSSETMAAIHNIYRTRIRSLVHHYW